MPILSDLRKTENAALGVGGVTYYDTLDSLPITGLTSGDQAFVSATERYYVSDGNGWFNTTLINRNIRWDSGGEPSASYSIVDSATPLIITARAADSDNSNFLNQSFGSDSAQFMATVTNDSSVFTFTPKTAAQIGASIAAGDLTDSNGDFIYTFKWSDGLSFVNKAVTITYNLAGGGSINSNNYGNRGFQIGYSNANTSTGIRYWNMSSSSNAQTFGTLSSGKQIYKSCCFGDGTYAFRAGGQNYDGGYVLDDIIERWATATTGNSSDFGDLTSVSMNSHADTNGTRAIVSKGRVGSASSAYDQSNYTGKLDYFATATNTNATDFGTDDIGRDQSTCVGNGIRMVSLGGYRDPDYLKVCDYVTFDTLGNGTDFGNLTQENHIAAGAGTGAGDRGIHAGGLAKPGNTGASAYVDNIEYLDVSTLGDATDAGNLLSQDGYHGGCHNAEYAHIFGRDFPGTNDTIQQTVLATAGNSTDFGNLIGNSSLSFGTSGADA
tara:strand:- start:4964 stop:6448 length:1485 start_codon:yes stop_codon:yes gene_type:complete